ncbi:MAG: hypothetical protein ABEN55_08450, partial [Bradymonadaceae bacterium]
FGAIQLHGMATGFIEARTWWEAAIRWAGPMLGGLVVGWGAVWLLSGGLGSPHIRLESDAIELSGGQRIPYHAIRRVGSAEHQSGTGRDRYTWSAMLIEWETDQDSLERTNISPALYTIQDTDNALADALAERVGCERERIERRLLGLYYDFPS